MSATQVIFPAKKLPAMKAMFHPSLVSRSGGVSIAGSEQIVTSGAGRWIGKLSFQVAFGLGSGRIQDTVLIWRAILAQLQGRTNILVVGPFDSGNTPAYIAGNELSAVSATFSDGAAFSDGSEFATAQTPAGVVGAVATGATALTVDMLAGHTPEPGQYFSVNNRLFLIQTATAGSGNQWDLSVWPPAREAIGDGASAEFDDPVCMMRLASDVDGQIDFSAYYYSEPTINLVEAAPES